MHQLRLQCALFSVDRLLALMSAVALLAACASTPTSPGESTAGGPKPSEAALICPPIDLRARDGSAVNLNGVWRSDDLGAYYIRHSESCVAWLGVSDYPGRELGQDWTNVFTGLMASDFSISGTWADIEYPSPRAPTSGAYAPAEGEIVLTIDWDEDLRPILTLPFGTSNYLGHVWVPDASLPPAEEIDGVLGEAADGTCVYVESAGIRYALITGDRYGSTEGDWTLSLGRGLRDRNGQVGAVAGDAIRVLGRPFPLRYGPCLAVGQEGWAGLLVETLAPSP